MSGRLWSGANGVPLSTSQRFFRQYEVRNRPPQTVAALLEIPHLDATIADSANEKKASRLVYNREVPLG